MRRMIFTACSISFFCLVLERASDNGSKLVFSLILLQFRSNIAAPKVLQRKKTVSQCYLIHETNYIFTKNEGSFT